LDDDDGVFEAGGLDSDLFSTDANAFAVLDGANVLSDDDGKVNAVVGGVVVWLVELDGDDNREGVPKVYKRILVNKISVELWSTDVSGNVMLRERRAARVVYLLTSQNENILI
jgi:hypothetical protein